MELKRKITTKFKKDFKKFLKSEDIITEFEKTVKILAQMEKLPIKYKDHALKWEYMWARECHIKPDLLLIYKIDNWELELLLLRMWSHSDLF